MKELVAEEVKEMGGEEKVKELEYFHMDISRIEGLNNLRKLTHLNLSWNEISKIEGLSNLRELTHLDLDRNKISKIEGLTRLTNLKGLHLNENSITKIEGLTQLSNLKELYLSHNSITKIEGLSQLSKLEKLNLWGNKIRVVENLQGNLALTEVNLKSNPVAEICPLYAPFYERQKKCFKFDDSVDIGKCLQRGEESRLRKGLLCASEFKVKEIQLDSNVYSGGKGKVFYQRRSFLKRTKVLLFEGSFSKMQRVGKGTVYDPLSGKKRFDGVWENDILIKKTDFNLRDYEITDEMKKIVMKIRGNTETIGGGGYADVYKMEVNKVDRAVKLIKQNEYRNRPSFFVKEFESRLKLMFSLNHPNIIEFVGYSSDTASRTVGVVIELGVLSVKNLIERSICKSILMKLHLKVRLLLDVARGMSYLHRSFNNIIHRDLKWGNVVICKDGLVKLIDFGESREHSSGSISTKTHQVGTPWFIAPEVMLKDKDGKSHYNEKVDQFSFGVMIYVLYFDLVTKDLRKYFYDDVDFFKFEKNKDIRPKDRKFSKGEKWLKELMEACWDSDPTKRPAFKDILKTLQLQKDVGTKYELLDFVQKVT